MKKIAFWNNKGGVAKTTISANIAYALAEMGNKILTVDCDSQRNLYEFFSDDSGTDGIKSTRYPNIDTAVWSDKIAEVGVYDFAIFDFPPVLNGSVKEMLSQCGYVFVPIELGSFSIKGVSAVADCITEAGVEFIGCFITKYDKSNSSDVALAEVMNSNLAEKMMKTKIPFSKTVKNSINFRQTAFEYMHWNSSVVLLGDLTEEILERIGD
jgi:chromosome partitioning protein